VRRAWRVALLLALPAMATWPSAARAAPTARSLLERSQLTLGEATEWVVVLENAGSSAPEPLFYPPDWARVQPLGTSQSMSIVNGRFASATSYRFLLVPARTGRHTLPAVAFEIGRTRVTSPPVPVDVLPPAPGGEAPGRGGSRLRLVATLDKPAAVVGEPVRLTVRFYLGMRLAADPQYRAPDVAGFWAEPVSVPRSYYVDEGGSRWLVSETHTVLYPTVPGRLKVGAAKMLCALPAPGAQAEPDPLSSLLGGSGGGSEVVEAQSRPLFVDVTTPPADGRPRAFRGTVADVTLSLRPERTRVRADETINLALRLSGTGNLRLAAPPAWPALDDFELYSRSTRDSIDLEGATPSGTKVLEFALLPRRRGQLTIPALEYATFVPGRGYQVTRSAPIAVQVDAPLAEVGGARSLTPLEVPRGVRRPPGPWAGWLAALLGSGSAALAAAWLARGRRAGHGEAAESAVRGARERLAERRGRGDLAAYYGEAERILGDPHALGGEPLAPAGEEEGARRLLLGRAQAARYAPGGLEAELESFAALLDRHLEARLGRVRRATRPRRARWAALAGFATLALAGAAYGGWRIAASRPPEVLLAGWRAAAQSLGSGDRARAAAQLSSLWSAGYRGGPLAAQCALAELGGRRLGAAALWAERARRESPRDPFVRSVRGVLDEEGALPGHPEGLGTLLTWREAALAAALAWALGALAWALGSLAAGRRRRLLRSGALALAGLALLAAAVTFGVWRAGFAARGAVIVEAVPLRAAPAGREQLDLEPGRLVEFREAKAGWVRIGLGGGLQGWVPATALDRVAAPQPPGARAAPS